MTEPLQESQPMVLDGSPKSTAGTRRLLIVAWEYPGMGTRQGTALARRVGQLARGFAERGWNVDVLHRATASDASNVVHVQGIHLHAVRDESTSSHEDQAALVRRITTAWYAALHGDRSERWARLARRQLSKFDGMPPQLVIGCFTPRGPLTVARAAARRWSVQWIADLQDPALDGSSELVRPLVSLWMRRTLRTASAVVQVSPEWAKTDAALLGRDVNTLRHAVPLSDVTPATGSVDPRADLVLLYAGSLTGGQQSPSELVSAVNRLNQHPGRRIVLEVAGGDATLQGFEQCLPSTGFDTWFRPLGWLGAEHLAAAIRRADCLVLIPSNEPGRPVVPSKLYEYVAYERPVLVAGADSGALSSLFEEWGHENVTLPNADAIVNALERVRSGDYSMTLRRSTCARPPMDETELVKRYIQLAPAALLPRD